MFEFNGLEFGEAMDLLPDHIRIWLRLIMVTAVLGLVFPKKREALVIAIAFIVSVPFSMFLYSQVGLSSKLLGLGHVVFWLPAAIYAVVRLKNNHIKNFASQGLYQKVFIVWLAFSSSLYLISNFWDVPDAITYIANTCWTETSPASSPSCHHADLLNRLASR